MDTLSMDFAAEEQAPKSLSVSAAMAKAKGALESFTVRLIGEVCEVNNKPGYKAVYFTVKDDRASLPCMMWLNRFAAAGVDLRVGALVELVGRFTLYAPKGRMNFDVFELSLAGEGNLRMRVADLAKRLEAEGLMSATSKRKIPRFPQTIGLVTSPRGAAVHDVLRTLRRRFPLARVLVAGVPVEGERAAEGLCEALETTQAAGAQVILLVRGGGSFEDLMPFNDEKLARTIASSTVPIVTGIGHEPDTTIADMVSDVRASTPTAAAETVSPSHELLEGLFDTRLTALNATLTRRLEREAAVLDRLAARSLFRDPHQVFAAESQTIDLLSQRLERALPLRFERDAQRLQRSEDRLRAQGDTLNARFEAEFALAASRLHDLSPLAILSRGYAIARDEAGAVIKHVATVAVDDRVDVDVADGRLRCRIESKQETTISSREEDND